MWSAVAKLDQALANKTDTVAKKRLSDRKVLIEALNEGRFSTLDGVCVIGKPMQPTFILKGWLHGL